MTNTQHTVQPLDIIGFQKAYNAAKNSAKHYPDVEVDVTIRDLTREQVERIASWHGVQVFRPDRIVNYYWCEIRTGEKQKITAMSKRVRITEIITEEVEE